MRTGRRRFRWRDRGGAEGRNAEGGRPGGRTVGRDSAASELCRRFMPSGVSLWCARVFWALAGVVLGLGLGDLRHEGVRIEVELEEFPRLYAAGIGHLEYGLELHVGLTTRFDRLVVFIFEPGAFGKGFLGQPKIFPEAFHTLHQPLCQVVAHDRD